MEGFSLSPCPSEISKFQDDRIKLSNNPHCNTQAFVTFLDFFSMFVDFYSFNVSSFTGMETEVRRGIEALYDPRSTQQRIRESNDFLTRVSQSNEAEIICHKILDASTSLKVRRSRRFRLSIYLSSHISHIYICYTHAKGSVLGRYDSVEIKDSTHRSSV